MAVDKTYALQTKCKTCFGGPRMILQAHWKNTFPKKGFGFFSVTWRSRSDVSQSVTHSLTDSELADLTDVTLVSDDTFRRHGTWVTHDHLSSVIESVRPS